MKAHDPHRLFFALTLRLERVHRARRLAWMRDDKETLDRLSRRAFELTSRILNIPVQP